jgi:hypothetical protein
LTCPEGRSGLDLRDAQHAENVSKDLRFSATVIGRLAARVVVPLCPT